MSISEQAIFPLIIPLFAAHREYEISKYDKTMISMDDYKRDLLIILKLNCSANKYESDFVKIHREMKALIDQQIDLGVNAPTCYAPLVESNDCYLYRMSLEYKAEYRANLIPQSRMLRDVFEIMLHIPAINTLSYLNVTINASYDPSRSQQNQSPKKSLKRPSFKKSVRKEQWLVSKEGNYELF